MEKGQKFETKILLFFLWGYHFFLTCMLTIKTRITVRPAPNESRSPCCKPCLSICHDEKGEEKNVRRDTFVMCMRVWGKKIQEEKKRKKTIKTKMKLTSPLSLYASSVQRNKTSEW